VICQKHERRCRKIGKEISMKRTNWGILILLGFVVSAASLDQDD
jgi:hypothetical protein